MTKTYSAKIEAIYSYPVKSLQGIPLASSKLNRFGLVGDRKWMLVDEKKGFLSQRKLPAMATISTAIRDGKIFLSKPGLGEIELQSSQEKRLSVSIWRDHCTAFVAAPNVNLWLSEALESNNIKCVQFIENEIRTPGELLRFGDTARHFCDGSPFLITTVESLNALNTALLENSVPAVDMRHFRANIVVSGIDAFTEHNFNTLSIAENNDTSSLKFTLVDHCQRCSIITVDPDTGKFRKKGTPLVELAKLNSMPNKLKAPAFGVNATLQMQEPTSATLQANDQANDSHHQLSPVSTELAVGQMVVFS